MRDWTDLTVVLSLIKNFRYEAIMEASFSRRKLVTPAELKMLNARSNLWGTGQMASHLGAILLVGYLHSLALNTGWVWVTGFALGVCSTFYTPPSMSLAMQLFLLHARLMRFLADWLALR